MIERCTRKQEVGEETERMSYSVSDCRTGGENGGLADW